MRARAWLLPMAVLLATTASAQDASVVAPHAYRTQFENDLVKVTRVHYAPHEILAEHAHPGRPSIFVYLNNGGPVLFKHQHGESGDYGATRPATKAGSYRLAAPRSETHIVENRSELASDFLQVELKTAIDAKGFSGRRFRAPEDEGHSYARVEFESRQVRIVRVGCGGSSPCDASAVSGPALWIRLSGESTGMSAGETNWLPPESVRSVASHRGPAEFLLIEIRKP